MRVSDYSLWMYIMEESDNFLAWHGKQKAIFTDAKEQAEL